MRVEQAKATLLLAVSRTPQFSMFYGDNVYVKYQQGISHRILMAMIMIEVD